MTEAEFFQVDAFSAKPFSGNPAAICFMSTDLDDELYLHVAKEMNLSETAFVHPISKGVYSLRWFTPVMEVPLCGHATLASAHVLFSHQDYESDKVTFKTLSGELFAFDTPSGVLMDFPRNDPEQVPPPTEVLKALGIDSWLDVQHSYSNEKLLVHVDCEETVRDLEPDFDEMLEASNTEGWKGVIVTSEADNYDFISRYFAPWRGVNEDPVTGSAHTVLTPYWANKLGKKSMTAYQASERGGELTLQLTDSRVKISGKATTIITGTLYY